MFTQQFSILIFSAIKTAAVKKLLFDNKIINDWLIVARAWILLPSWQEEHPASGQ